MGFAGNLSAGLYLFYCSFNQLRGISGCLSRSHCQISHILGNHCESTTGFTGSGRLNHGIQGKEIGLKCLSHQ